MATNSRRPLRIDRYVQLVRQFPLVHITSEAELDRAIAVIDNLLEKDRTAEEEAYLDVLSTIVEVYEEREYPIHPVSDAAALSDLLESKGVSQAQLSRATGIAESTISSVLSGSRRLTRAHVGKLAAYFQVSPEVFPFPSQQG